MKGKESLQRPIWPIVVFAHNGERYITKSLDKLRSCEKDVELEIFVIANGCSDDTEIIVGDYIKRNPCVNLISLTYGDKSNAWNYYIHEMQRNSDVHFFTDGDVFVVPGSLTHLKQALDRHPYAIAGSSLPFSGRSREAWRRFILNIGGMPGGLYALRDQFVQNIREKNVYLPRGFIGEDVLLQLLIKTNLCPEINKPNKDRIKCSELSGFNFDSFSPFDIRDWKLYIRRKIRNALRSHQTDMLFPLLKASGIKAMPSNIKDLYEVYLVSYKHKWSDRDFLFSLLAIREIKKEIGTP